jgi:hypothetical protein
LSKQGIIKQERIAERDSTRVKLLIFFKFTGKMATKINCIGKLVNRMKGIGKMVNKMNLTIKIGRTGKQQKMKYPL